MPKAKISTSLVGMVDSDMEQHSDVDMMLTPESNQENAEPEKKSKGRPKTTATKVRKTKPASRRLSGGSKPKGGAKKKAPAKRAPLKEQANEEQLSEIEEVETFPGETQRPIEQVEVTTEKENTSEITDKAPAKKGRPNTKSKQSTKHEAVEQVKAIEKENDGEFEYTPTAARQVQPAVKHPDNAKKVVASRRQASVDQSRVIPETQPAPMDTEATALSIEYDEADDLVPQSVYRQVNHARANSKQRQPSVTRRRAGSASDTERGNNDPVVRRKLGEMTKKFENLDLKYRNLRDVGIKEAEANFEKLKKQSEERTKAANDLITALKSDLATQRTLASASTTLRTELNTARTDLTAAQARIAELTASLTAAQSETNVLNAKLAAARATSATVESSDSYTKTPGYSKAHGSALKGKASAAATRTVMVGSAEAAQAAQIAGLKEDLYGDLTGLILRGVERTAEADVYDCIQTGRNGTLHFHLSLPAQSPNGPPSSYDEAEFTYTPRLDGNRDRELIELLPDYLSEEITFSRVNAAKFYARVVEVLMRKVET